MRNLRKITTEERASVSTEDFVFIYAMDVIQYCIVQSEHLTLKTKLPSSTFSVRPPLSTLLSSLQLAKLQTAVSHEVFE